MSDATINIIGILLSSISSLSGLINIGKFLGEIISKKRAAAPEAKPIQENPNDNTLIPVAVIYALDRYQVRRITWYNLLNFFFPLMVMVLSFLFMDFGKLFVLIIAVNLFNLIQFWILCRVGGMITLLEGYLDYKTS